MANTELTVLNNIKLGENGTIKSVDLVDIINHFRLEEGKAGNLTHDNLMKRIKEEIKALKEANISLVNFNESKYINSRGKEYNCFELNEEGMLEMLNKESAVTRYKTVQYIKQLKQENKELTEDLVEVSEIAMSDKEQAKREYETKKKLYGYKRIKNVLENCTYKDIEDKINDIMDFHTNKLKKKDRAFNYSELDKTSYKQVIRDRIDVILENIYNTTLDGTLRTVAKELQYVNQKDKIKTINRSNSHKECATCSN